MISKFAKKWWWVWVVGIILIVHLSLMVANSTYAYKALLYNYVDLDDYTIFPNDTISASTAPQPWPSQKTTFEFTPALLNYLDSIDTKSLLVIRRDTVLYERYFDEYTDSTIGNSFSVAKSVVSILVGMSLREGKIKSLDQKVAEYLPEFSNGKKSSISIRHLLTMSSGLNWDESYAALFSTTTESYYGTDITRIINTLEVVEEPGTTFRYKSGDTQILAMILKKATGKSVSKLATELWEKLGATQNALWSKDRNDGIEKSFCCINSTARDFARIGSLFLKKGNWNGIQLVDTAFVEASLRPCNLKDEDNQNQCNFYGFQWWLIPEEQVFYARGILGQYVMVHPPSETIMVRLGGIRGTKIGKHYKESLEIIKEVKTWK